MSDVKHRNNMYGNNTHLVFASWESSPPLHTQHEDIFPHFCSFYFPIYTMSFIIDTRWMRIIYNTITKFGHQIYHSCFLLFLPRLKLHFHMQHYSFKAIYKKKTIYFLTFFPIGYTIDWFSVKECMILTAISRSAKNFFRKNHHHPWWFFFNHDHQGYMKA